MLLQIEVEVTFKFETPTRRSVKSLSLTPQDSEGQKVKEWSLTSEGAKLCAGFLDGAGDYVVSVSAQQLHSEFSVCAKGVVETTAVEANSVGMSSPLVYLRDPDASHANQAMLKIVAGLQAKGEARADDVFKAILGRVRLADVEAQTLTGVLETGEANALDMIKAIASLARRADVPARHVTGFVADVQDFAHWVELYAEDTGWVGYDPSTGKRVDERYVRLCSGLDALDASPIREASATSADVLDIKIKVAAL